jgi:hypothetical protein
MNERDEAFLLNTLAKSLCAEFFRGQFEFRAPHDDAGYRAKIESSWHDWIPQAKAVVNTALRGGL